MIYEARKRQAEDVSSSISDSPSPPSTSETSLSSSTPSATPPEKEREEEEEDIFSSSSCGIDFEFCKEAERGLLAPDAVYYLDIQPSEAQARGGYGELRTLSVTHIRKNHLAFFHEKPLLFIFLSLEGHCLFLSFTARDQEIDLHLDS